MTELLVHPLTITFFSSSLSISPLLILLLLDLQPLSPPTPSPPPSPPHSSLYPLPLFFCILLNLPLPIFLLVFIPLILLCLRFISTSPLPSLFLLSFSRSFLLFWWFWTTLRPLVSRLTLVLLWSTSASNALSPFSLNTLTLLCQNWRMCYRSSYER